MNRDEALALLLANQPMPPTRGMPSSLAQGYDAVRKYFLDHPDRASIRPFLNSFGEGDCYGAYQLVEDVIAQHEPSHVVPELRTALASPHPSVRYSSAQIATRFPSRDLLLPLARMLQHDDSDSRMAAATAIERIGSVDARAALLRRRPAEPDLDVAGFIDQILKEWNER